MHLVQVYVDEALSLRESYQEQATAYNAIKDGQVAGNVPLPPGDDSDSDELAREGMAGFF